MIVDAEITSKKLITKDVWEIAISHNNDEFYFNAGQYVWIITPSGRRSFSIASSSTNPKNLKIVFRGNDKSDYKKYLLNKANNKVQIRGPLGSLRIPKEPNKVVFIIGGVAIPPVLSIARTMAEKKINGKFTLIYANHTIDGGGYSQELESLPNVNLVLVTGKIKKEHVPLNSSFEYIVLGPQVMVNGVYDILQNIGVDDENITFEENYPQKYTFELDNNDTSYFKSAVDQSINHIIMTDLNGRVLYANRAATETTGFSFSEMQGQTPRLWGGLMEANDYRNFWQTIKKERKPFKGEFKNRRKNGEIYYVLAMVSPISDKNGNLVGFLGIEQDVTQEKTNILNAERLQNIMVDRELKMIELKKLITKNE